MTEMALLADGVERFCSDSLSLAKLEVRDEARFIAREIAWKAPFGMVLGLGYGILCVGVALVLAASIGTAWALVAIGSVNVVAGAIGLRLVGSPA